MRTTVAFEPDVAAEIERLRRERAEGVSAVVNDLIRRGMAATAPRPAFVQTTSDMGARVDVSNITDLLETIDGPAAR